MNTLYPPAVGPISSTATVLPDGRVLLAGNNPADLYDPVTDTFNLTGRMSAPVYLYGMYGHTATLLPNGKVLVTGGSDELSLFDNAELYNPATGTFSSTGAMTARRAFHTATSLPDGTVLIAGGETWLVFDRSGRFGGSLDSAERYDPSTGRFAATDGMTVSRSGHSATLLQNGNVLITGGVQYLAFPPGGVVKYFGSAELYVPATAK